MATINYYGLTKKGSVTVALTVTIDQLITAIATDEVLATEYYTVSAMNDFSKSSLTYGDSSTTLTQLGLADGGTVLCTTNQTGSKEERQVSKLAIAGKKRSLTSRTSTLTINNLPTKYTGNDVTDNANGAVQVAGAGLLSASTSSKIVTGSGTNFTTLTVGTVMTSTYGNFGIGTIESIQSDTQLTLTSNSIFSHSFVVWQYLGSQTLVAGRPWS
jgi:hypothetical protein